MQKFVIKKITRSTNITIEDQNFLDAQALNDESDVENLEKTGVRMCGYLKKKRNFAGWQKLYFVLQNGLLMSYNSKEEYEKKIVSFKDVICLIPGHSVLLPSLEPRFTIASNLNTFYTFRCFNQQECSKWITSILDCLSREITSQFTGKKIGANFHSQQNLNTCLKVVNTPKVQSWENLLSGSKWLINDDGRILLELNYINCHRAKLPIANQTAKILKNAGNSNVIHTTKKINYFSNDETHTAVSKKNDVQNKTHHAHHQFPKKPDQFRLHNDTDAIEKKSRVVNRISKIFPTTASTSSTEKSTERESQRPDDNFLMQSNGIENGVEEQQLELSFGEEYSMFSITGDYASVDSNLFNNKLNIENVYSEIGSNPKGIYSIPENIVGNSKWVKTRDTLNTPEYSVINLSKKYEERMRKSKFKHQNQEGENKLSAMMNHLNFYEDIEKANNRNGASQNDEFNIYEPIDIRPSLKARSLVWKNWSRMPIFNSWFRENDSSTIKSFSSSPSETILKKKRYQQEESFSLSDFNLGKHFYSLRQKVKKIYQRGTPNITLNNPSIILINDSTQDSKHHSKTKSGN